MAHQDFVSDAPTQLTRTNRNTRIAGILAAFGVWVAVAGGATLAAAADCGGNVICLCGDRVVASTTLTQDLEGLSCRGNGLSLAPGVVLDCAGRTIGGPGDRTPTVGVLLDHSSGAKVVNCRVKSFGRGIRVDGTDGAEIRGNEVFSNNYGVEVADGSVNTLIDSNNIRDNRDEGVHLGGTSSRSTVIGNRLYQNRSENLYLIQSTDNTVIGNNMDRSKEAAILVKHSSRNTFSDNVIRTRNVMVLGDSADNLFEDTLFYAGSYTFNGLELDTGWVFPQRNTVTGGALYKASTCFRFTGAFDNHATGVQTFGCRPAQFKDIGGQWPVGNRVCVFLPDQVVETCYEPKPAPR